MTKSHEMEWERDGYVISTDHERLDHEVIWQFLRTTYWATNISRSVLDRSIENALVFSLLSPAGDQAGFARAVTDRARLAWLSDVFVLERYRGTGLGVWLVQVALSHPYLLGLRVILGTADAHGLYERFGFQSADATRVMELPAARQPALPPRQP